MTLVSEILVAAYRESNYTAVGATPTADEQTEALALLQSLMGSVFPMVVGTKLKPWYFPWPQKNAARAANYPAAPGDSGITPPNSTETPPANVRLMMKNTAEQRVYFQYQPQDGALMEYVDIGHTATVILDANGQLFETTGSDTEITITSDFPASRNPTRRWIYRADVGSWVELTTLTLVDEMAFPIWFDDYFITALAIRLAPRFGNEPRQTTIMRYTDMNVFLRGQYEQMGIVMVGSPGGHGATQNWDNEVDAFDGGDFSSGLT